MRRYHRICYLKLCVAGIKEDMAQRIMYSVLPSLADKHQVELTGGVVDYKALKAAVEGRKNIIDYGLKSIINELRHYQNNRANQTKKDVINLTENNHLEEALDLAVNAFSNTQNWIPGYGGIAWKMIAKTLRQIIRLDNHLSLIRRQPRTADNQQKEIQLMKDIVVELNIFDGLAHNTDSIMRNIIEQENISQSNPKSDLWANTYNYNEIKKLMDAKELDSPIDVYKAIQQILIDSGDINKFKDWVAKLRAQPETFKQNPHSARNAFRIYFRKNMLSKISNINEIIDYVSHKFDKFDQIKKSFFELDRFAKECERLFDVIDSVLHGKIIPMERYFYKLYPEYESNEYVVNLLSYLKQKGSRIYSAALEAMEYINEFVGHICANPKDKNIERYYQKISDHYHELLTEAKSFVYLLDSV